MQCFCDQEPSRVFAIACRGSKHLHCLLVRYNIPETITCNDQERALVDVNSHFLNKRLADDVRFEYLVAKTSRDREYSHDSAPMNDPARVFNSPHFLWIVHPVVLRQAFTAPQSRSQDDP